MDRFFKLVTPNENIKLWGVFAGSTILIIENDELYDSRGVTQTIEEIEETGASEIESYEYYKACLRVGSRPPHRPSA